MRFARLRKIILEWVMSIAFPSGFATPSPTASVGPSKSASATASLATSLATKPAETAAQKFLDYANMTPAERLQAQMLNQLGITEDQFKAMSPADQQKILDKIREMVKQQVQNSSDKHRDDHRHIGLRAGSPEARSRQTGPADFPRPGTSGAAS
jgi:hypothetical protein